MPQKVLSMRKIKEVLRLRYDLGLLQNEIARSCCISQSSVNRYLERASAAHREESPPHRSRAADEPDVRMV